MTEPARPRAGVVIVTVLVGGWAVGLTLLVQLLGWGGEQVLVVFGLPLPGWAWPVASLVTALLVAGPAALLALLPAAPVIRVIGRAWLAGAGATGLLGAVRAVPGREPELYLALLAVTAAVLAYALRRATAPPAPPPAAAPTWPGWAAGLVLLLPWLWLGALGGAGETLFALAAAGALGWLAATVLGPGFWAPWGAARTARVLLGGLAAGVALLLVAAGAGGNGVQLALLLVLPPVGFLAAALGARRWQLAGLVGLAGLGPLGFVDPEEVTLLLPGRDVPFWMAVAATASLLLGLLLGLAGWLVPRWWRRPTLDAPGRWWGGAVVAALVVAASIVHIGLGQPGLHGERLFVVLAEQADLTGIPPATGPAGRDARAGEVYRRLVSHAETSQADLRADLARFGLAYTPYYLVNAVEVSGGPEVRAWLAGRGDVDRVLTSQRLRPLPATPPVATGTAALAPDPPEWNITAIGADRVWTELGVTGAGIVVGSSDSGADGSHPVLADGFRGGGDSWLDPWSGAAYPRDRGGHGTHTLGSAVGRGGFGVAPAAQWTACVNLDRNLGNPARYLDCLQFMLAPYPPGGDPFRDGAPDRAPHVLTNSWGCPPIEGCDPAALRPATAALAAAGIYPVVAAGNAGPLCGSIQDPPAPYPDVLTVGATDRSGQVAGFSSRGPVPGVAKPDLVAPGAGVISAMPGGGYATLSGTSMAAPHVAGVVALMWSADPALIGDAATTTAILRETARPVGGGTDRCGGTAALAGAGQVDAYAAVSAVLRAAPG